jgi:hypothetical protein
MDVWTSDFWFWVVDSFVGIVAYGGPDGRNVPANGGGYSGPLSTPLLRQWGGVAFHGSCSLHDQGLT